MSNADKARGGAKYRKVDARQVHDKHRLGRSSASVQNAVVLPDQNAIRRAVDAFICPWCGKGPLKVLAGHTVRVHGIDRIELRERAGLPYSASICDPEVARQCADRASQSEPLLSGRLRPKSKGRGSRNMSPAGRESSKRRLAAARSTEQQAAATRASHTPEVQARRTATVRKLWIEKRGPAEHGSRRRYTTLGCRCDECRAGNTERVRQFRAQR